MCLRDFSLAFFNFPHFSAHFVYSALVIIRMRHSSLFQAFAYF